MSTPSNQRPASLFKYRPWLPQCQRRSDGSLVSVNYTENLIREARFYCQGPRDFDDPHDSHTGPVPTGSDLDIDRFVIEGMAPVVLAMRKSGLTSLTQLSNVQTAESAVALRHLAGHTVRRDYRILCLSAVGDSELMWSFYADNHRGVCLEFDGTADCFAEMEEVCYADTPSDTANFHSWPIQAEALEKSSAWRHQQEWRLFSPDTFWPFPKSALKRVILGYRFPDPALGSLLQAIAGSGYEVEIAQMQRLPNSYQFYPVNRGSVAPTP